MESSYLEQEIASSNVTYNGKQEVELERETDRRDMALAMFKFSLSHVMIIEDLDLGEDRGVLDSRGTKAYRGLNLDPLCSRLHAGDRGLGSLGLSVVQCIREATVVLPGRQKRRHASSSPKRKKAFMEYSV